MSDEKLFERLTQLESFNSILTVQVTEHQSGSIISTNQQVQSSY